MCELYTRGREVELNTVSLRLLWCYVTQKFINTH